MIGLGTLNRRMTEFYYNIVTSIAFYPIIITICYLVLVSFMLKFDYSEAALELSEELRWLQFKELDAVRAIMTTLIAGVISLMALSFSMVMVVLNQATSTVSPKVMQGLVTKKEHQFVLGNQFGAILYFIVLLLLLRGLNYYRIPTFSITLGLLIGFWAMGLFVYFIHSISQSIQVTNIVSNIHLETFRVLEQLRKKEEKKVKENASLRPLPSPISSEETPFEYMTDKPGFLQELNLKALLKVVKKNNLKIRMEPHFTDFIACGATLFWANIPPENLNQKDRHQIYNTILFFNNENIQVNHVYGFTQLSEIALKSLSPGINDPGIAVMCIHYLADLFVNLYALREEELYADAENVTRLQVKNIDFPNLLNLTISPIRYYGQNNESVVRAILGLLMAIAKVDLKERKYQVLLNQHAAAALDRIGETLIVPADASNLHMQMERMQQFEPSYFTLPKLVIRP